MEKRGKLKEALLYKEAKDGFVRCRLCHHFCVIAEGKAGICAVRQNLGGKLFTHSYGRLVAANVDPIEKKPLYHFLPGSKSFSIATAGCNFRCGFCQNWEISQKVTLPAAGEMVFPEDIVKSALRNRCQSISYTYTEPTIFFEYAYETAKVAKEAGLFNVFVTNGYMTAESLEMIRPYLDAANVDLKFFRDESYKNICGASLQPVLDSIILMRKAGIWAEVTTLIVPGENDSDSELKGIAGFLASVDKDMPWHISRFHPDYKFTGRPFTPENTLKKAQAIGKDAGLKYVYIGNTQGLGDDTVCPQCNKPVIRRQIFSVTEYNINKGKCAFCGAIIAGLFL